MFTGIVEAIGTVIDVQPNHENMTVTLRHNLNIDNIKIGDSIAVNGVCLTIIAFDHHQLQADVMPETMGCTNLGGLKPGVEVNLEKSLLANSPIGGHFVQGHVDETVAVLAINTDNEIRLRIALPQQYRECIVHKGYVAIDGMSLTVAACTNEYFEIALIPHTLANTIAQHYQPGTLINLEVDILAKYIQNKKSGEFSCV
ncbi:MAG: riboflavin synthase [Legionellales bacterium]|nr:riboflavin synthase [Legionellales bacterium]|tara:strand:- start:36884 stop:37483 length:600 start_codon:yes stop_codon:yes gene_type:complete